MKWILHVLVCAVLGGVYGQQHGHHNHPAMGGGTVNPAKPHWARDRVVVKPRQATPGIIPTTVTTQRTERSIPATRPTLPTTVVTPRPPPTFPTRPRTRARTKRPRQISCHPNPCHNRGTCRYGNRKRTVCHCPHLYIGNFCEVVVVPPKNITVTEVSTDSVHIAWLAPPRTKEVAGYVVQHNEFGSMDIQHSHILHASVNEFTLRNLESSRQYTICISLVFHNVTIKNALLRDQCREIHTKPLAVSDSGLSMRLMGVITGSMVLLLLIVMIIALIMQRRCLQKKVIPVRIRDSIVRGSVLSHRGMQSPPPIPRNIAQPIDDQEDTAKIRPAGGLQLSTNPFCNRGVAEPEYGNVMRHGILRSNHVLMLGNQCMASSLEGKYSPNSSALIPYSRNRQLLQRVSSVPSGNVRALPPTISNLVIKSSNARDIDASNEFDLHRTFFLS